MFVNACLKVFVPVTYGKEWFSCPALVKIAICGKSRTREVYCLNLESGGHAEDLDGQTLLLVKDI
jgi:hypothetical protein